MLPAKHFYMIRHGETEANAAQVMAGSLDSPLNEKGRAQAKAVQQIVIKLKIKPTVIVHSHLSRARDTATIINEVLGLPMHEDSDLAELHAGDWEGKPYDTCGPMMKSWHNPPGGETFDEFCDRIRRGKTRALEKHHGPILIVCHGGVFRGLGKIYGLDIPGVFKNCHLHEFHPNPLDKKFPWTVWHYDHLENVVRNQTLVFHESKLLE